MGGWGHWEGAPPVGQLRQLVSSSATGRQLLSYRQAAPQPCSYRQAHGTAAGAWHGYRRMARLQAHGTATGAWHSYRRMARLI